MSKRDDLASFLLAAALAATPLLAGEEEKAKARPGGAGEDIESLSRQVEDALGLASDYRAEGISPQEIQEVKQLLDLPFPRTTEGAELKARVYVELARIYGNQGISPMAIKLLQDAIVDLTGHVDAEIALREELVAIYRSLGFAPQAIREHKRVRQLRSR